MNLILWLAFGALIGWLAGKIMKTSMSLFISIVLGIAGAVAGSFVAGILGLGSLHGMFSFRLGNIVISVAGACLVMWLVNKFWKKS